MNAISPPRASNSQAPGAPSAGPEPTVFVTGGTGYLGRHLIPALAERGHHVLALARPASIPRLPPGCTPLAGDALDAGTYERAVPPGSTFVHLVGVAHPSPAKAAAFRSVDLVSVQQAVRAAVHARARHFIYLSVAQPAPIMRAYQAVRAEGEALIRSTGLPATFLRPWYVLGPGHQWPRVLQPFYWAARRIPALREGALRTALVTLPEMTRALIRAVEDSPLATRVWTAECLRTCPLPSRRATG